MPSVIEELISVFSGSELIQQETKDQMQTVWVLKSEIKDSKAFQHAI